MDHTEHQIKIHVRFYGHLADYAAIKNIDMAVPGRTTVTDFLEYVSDCYPKVFNKDQMDPLESHSIVKVFKNSELITPEMDHQWLEEGDEIRFFSAISGG